MTPRILLAGAAAATVLAVVPTSASAIVVTPLKACQTVGSGQGILATITGGTPGGGVSVSGPAGSTSGTLDAAGNVPKVPFDYGAPSGSRRPSTGRTATLTATDAATGQVATVRTTFTRLAASVTGGTTRRYSKRLFRASGFTPLNGNRTVYASWYRGGELVRRVRVGVSKNACGYVSRRMTADPGRRVGGRRFTIRFHSQKRYSRNALRVTGFTYTRIRF